MIRKIMAVYKWCNHQTFAIEVGFGANEIGREQQLVWRMWLGSIKELHPGRGGYNSMLASRREL